MRLFSCFSVETLSNCYLLGPSDGGDAVLVDPATFSTEALEIVERNGYYVRAVLLTHCDERHMGGLKTILRIYTDADVYAAVPRAGGIAANVVSEGEELQIGTLRVHVVAMPGMGTDCVAYRIGSILFAGTALTENRAPPRTHSPKESSLAISAAACSRSRTRRSCYPSPGLHPR